MSNEGGGDKPTKAEREAAAKPGCTCVLCAMYHGDQAPSAEDVVIASLQREVADLKEQLKFTTDMLAAESKTAVEIATDLAVLHAQVNSPEVIDFLEGVKRESAHQRERWATDDSKKTAAEWFWTVGYLAGKALHLPEKRLHHVITAAAALFNWHHYTKAGGP